MPGQKFGPAWFPGLIAAGLIACGAWLAFTAKDERWIVMPAWLRRPRRWRVSSVVLGLLFYVLAADTLGFYLTALLLLIVWMRCARRVVAHRAPGRGPSPRSSFIFRSTSCCAFPCHGEFSSASRSDMTASVLSQALAQVFDPYVLWVIFGSAMFGLSSARSPAHRDHGDRPARSGHFLHAAGAGDRLDRHATAMAIFAGDIPNCFLRMPGTPLPPPTR